MDGAKNAEQHPAGHAAPTAISYPCLALAALFAFDVALAQRPCGQAIALGSAPPAGAGEGKAPQDGLIFIEHNDLTLAGPILQGGACERGRGEGRRSGLKPSRRTAVTYLVFF